MSSNIRKIENSGKYQQDAELHSVIQSLEKIATAFATMAKGDEEPKTKKSKIRWFELFVKEWIPKMIPAFIAFMAVVYFGPMVHGNYMQQSSYYADKRSFVRKFVKNFSLLRMSIWNTYTVCRANPKNRNKLLKQYSHQTNNQFIKFIGQGYQLGLFYPGRTRKQYSNFIKWYVKQDINCGNAYPEMEKMLHWQRRIVNPMWKSLYK